MKIGTKNVNSYGKNMYSRTRLGSILLEAVLCNIQLEKNVYYELGLEDRAGKSPYIYVHLCRVWKLLAMNGFTRRKA